MTSEVKIACFGEILWDTMPDGTAHAGGAPFNVAYHLSRMGVEVKVISSVGNDPLGDRLLQKMENWQLSTEGVQQSTIYPTSQVLVQMGEDHEASYDIVQNVAWDYIDPRPGQTAFLARADALVFGSLATRNAHSRQTLFELLEASKFNVFDVNLRPPYYDVNVLRTLLHKSQLVKLNQAELQLVLDFQEKNFDTEGDSLAYLQDTFQIEELIVSKGSKGAVYASRDEFIEVDAVSVQVKDTIGSGDAFLAGFLSQRFLSGTQASQWMNTACALGAFITSNEGACPDYSHLDFNHFRSLH